MSFLCDFCSRSVGSRCGHRPEGVRVGRSCDRFAPTLQSVFGLQWLHDELSKGAERVRKELAEAARFNGFPEEETRRMLALADELPPAEYAPRPFPGGRPVLVFDWPTDRDRAVRLLEAEDMGGLREQRGLTLEFADLGTLADAASILIEAGACEFRVRAPGADGRRGGQ